MFANPHDRLKEGRNVIAPVLGPAWRPAFVQANHPLIPIVATDRNFVELIFTRIPGRARDADIYALQKLQEDLPLNLDRLAHYVFSLPHDVQLEPEIEMIGRIEREFSFLPKEILFLLERVLSAVGFTALDVITRDRLKTLQARLRAEYESAFPKGIRAGDESLK